MKKIMILVLFAPLMAISQKKPEQKAIPGSLPSVSLNEYSDDIANFVKYLGGLRQDVYESLSPKQTMQEFWRIVLMKRKKP